MNLQSEARSFEVGERHYDLGNDLYRAMLGKRMVYSCAYWRGGERPRRRAGSQARPGLPQARPAPGHARARHRLRVGRGAEVRGGALRHPRRRRHRVARAGRLRARDCARACRSRSACRITANSTNRFDRVFSLGMFEHVGVRNYDTYFDVARRCLRPMRRTAGCSCCTRSAAQPPVDHTDPWIERYIFPNSMLPSAKQIAHARSKGASCARTGTTSAPITTARCRRGARTWRRRGIGCRRVTTNASGACGGSTSPDRWPGSARGTSICGNSCCRRAGVPGGYVAPR